MGAPAGVGAESAQLPDHELPGVGALTAAGVGAAYAPGVGAFRAAGVGAPSIPGVGASYAWDPLAPGVYPQASPPLAPGVAADPP